MNILQIVFFCPHPTCGVHLAVVLPAVLHLDRRQAERLHHLVRSLTPVGGAEGRDGQSEGQRGQGQRQQGTATSGHVLQHGCLFASTNPNEKIPKAQQATVCL